MSEPKIKGLSIELMLIDDIKPYELNAKNHDKLQVEKIAQSIKQFGWDQPIVVDKHNVIIKGHGRRLASINLGLKQVPVLKRYDLTDDQVRAARLADNRVAISDLDAEILQQELATLTFDLEGIFDAKELDFMLADLGEINDGIFVEDMDVLVREQGEENQQKVAEINSREVKIAKALGFNNVYGNEERIVARFMALAEDRTGLEGSSAFVSYLKAHLDTIQGDAA